MRKVLDLFVFTCIILCATSCSKDSGGSDAPDDLIWDIYPTGVAIYLVDKDGNNLLDPDTEGNWVGEQMSISLNDDDYPAIWTYDDYQSGTRAMKPVFHGLVWSGIFPYADQKGAHLYFGEFDGASNHHMSLTFGIDMLNTVFDFKFTHTINWVKNEPEISNYITYKGKEIKGNKLEIVLPCK